MIAAVRFSMLALAAAAFGQSPPKDVNGWDKIKWGMTIADARAAYSLATQPETNEYGATLTLDPVKISDIAMNVNVGAKLGDTAPIRGVRLWMYFGLKSSAPSASARDFDPLKVLLMQKYGAPASEETKAKGDDHVKTLLWTFPSTSILLTLTQDRYGLGDIKIEYTATDKKALEKL